MESLCLNGFLLIRESELSSLGPRLCSPLPPVVYPNFIVIKKKGKRGGRKRKVEKSGGKGERGGQKKGPARRGGKKEGSKIKKEKGKKRQEGKREKEKRGKGKTGKKGKRWERGKKEEK